MEFHTKLEPMRLSVVSVHTAGLVTELSAGCAQLGHGLHAQSVANLADVARVMNAYCTNLI